jgi:hypothetical protein
MQVEGMMPAAGPAAAIGGMPGLTVSTGPAIAEGQAQGTSTTGAFMFGSNQAPQTNWAMIAGLVVIGGLIWWRTR